MVSDNASPALLHPVLLHARSKMLRPMRNTPRLWRSLLVIAAALLPASCAMPPANPFLGAWATSERNAITFRDASDQFRPLHRNLDRYLGSFVSASLRAARSEPLLQEKGV